VGVASLASAERRLHQVEVWSVHRLEPGSSDGIGGFIEGRAVDQRHDGLQLGGKVEAYSVRQGRRPCRQHARQRPSPGHRKRKLA
jgi:hypothetical protein